MSIKGTWKKVSAGAECDMYPEVISFKEGNLYEAQAAADAQKHPVWDAGTYKVADNRLDISTSADSIVGYDFEQRDNMLNVQDAEGRTIRYERM